MTYYELGFLCKCAENGVPPDDAYTVVQRSPFIRGLTSLSNVTGLDIAKGVGRAVWDITKQKAKDAYWGAGKYVVDKVMRKTDPSYRAAVATRKAIPEYDSCYRYPNSRYVEDGSEVWTAPDRSWEFSEMKRKVEEDRARLARIREHEHLMSILEYDAGSRNIKINANGV